jgi:hypothetical protein
MSLINTTRGVPFDPAASASVRERNQERQVRERAELDRLKLRAEVATMPTEELERLNPKKALARKLDEIEHAYRERARDRGR